MSAAEEMLITLQREKAVMQHSFDVLLRNHSNLRDAMVDALQVISDLIDEDCPGEFKEVAREELYRLRNQYIENY